MRRFILQPCSIRRLPNPRPSSELIPYLSAEEEQVLRRIGNGTVIVWGKNDRQTSRWTQIRPWDIALFCNQRVYFAQATVALTTRNPELASRFSQLDDDGKAQNNLIIYSDVSEINLPVEMVNKAIGYAQNAFLRQFTVLTSLQSAALQRLL